MSSLQKEIEATMDLSTEYFCGFLLFLFIFVKFYKSERFAKLKERISNSKFFSPDEIDDDIDEKEDNDDSESKKTKKKSVKIKKVKKIKRVVNDDMVEIVYTLAPNLTESQIRFDLQKTGSVEETINRYMKGEEFPEPTKKEEEEISNEKEDDGDELEEDDLDNRVSDSENED